MGKSGRQTGVTQAEAGTPGAQPDGIRNRVIERRRMRGSELGANPKNWRKHPEAQAAALRGLLEEVGQVGELYAYHSERAGGVLTLVDGHLRAALDPEQEWDVAVTDLTDAEADKVLLVRDPLGQLAESNRQALDLLMRDVQTGSEALAGQVEALAEANGIVPAGVEADLKRLEVKPPPPMTWVLVGIPTVRFGEIAADVERIAALPGVLVETTANAGEQENG